MEYATNDGVRLAYERRGPTDAPTVAFVEGIGYGRWMWRWQRQALDEEYDTIVWDNRGTGDSDTPEGPYTMSQFAGDLEAVFEDAGVASAHVVGASMGGMVAQQYALEYDRVRSLTLLCTSPGGPDAVPTPEATRARMFEVPEHYDARESRRYKMAAAMRESFMADNEDLVERIVDWRIESDAGEQALAWQNAAVQGFDAHDRLEAVTVPVLVMHGTADRVVPVENGESLAEGLPDAEFVRFEGAPHLFFVEEADRVNERLREFLADG
ncbi:MULTISPECIES: alpha/beta fold hydrolase [Haloarcula]|uniref:alpha/beta fold hydrolase n=1 Tax=Haloarcula TaxID=2237 RepID=UPI0023EC159D|nr:alpha/beta hydrolase [Halomicroarcula sp. XH51]